ncbi:hypothetical protein ES702_04236 [subsurface metagenome]
MKFERILVLSPHTDDAEVGAGGTIAKFIEEKAHLTALMFGVPTVALVDECKKAMKILGVEEYQMLDFKTRHFGRFRQQILQVLWDYNEKNQVDLVLTPSTLDLHQDHQTVTNEALRAFRDSTILGYELVGNHILLRENCFVPLEERHVQKKIEAVLCYKSQINLRPDRFTEDFLRSVVRSRAPHVKTKYAEAFEVIKLILK